MSCSDPHCASCCYQRSRFWTQKFTSAKKSVGSKTEASCLVLSNKSTAVLDVEPRHLGWEHKQGTSMLWQGFCCLWLFCWIPRDKWVEPVEPYCLLGQNLRRCQSLPTLNVPACRAIWLHPDSNQSVRQHLRCATGQGAYLQGNPEPRASMIVSTYPLFSRGNARGGWKLCLQVSSLAKIMRPLTTHDA